MVRELYGDFVEIISRFIGLRKVIASFNELIVENNILNSYDFWLENIIIDVDFDQQDLIAQRVTKFVNLYLIKNIEGLFRKNIDLLKYESQITYKILETGIMQKYYSVFREEKFVRWVAATIAYDGTNFLGIKVKVVTEQFKVS